MTLKQIKFNPFQHWENISDLYKTVLSKGGANSLLWTLALIIEKNGFTLCPYLIHELGVDFALMSQTGQLIPFDYQDIFDNFSFGLGDVSIHPIN